MKSALKKIGVFIIMSALMSTVAFAREGTALISYLSDEGGVNQAAYYYYQEDGYKAKNEWKFVRDNWYYFGDDGVSKQNMWFEIDGKWYYFNEKSEMLHDTVTPDGYTVDSDGAWITE